MPTPVPYTMIPNPPAGLGAQGYVDWSGLVLYTFTAGPTMYSFAVISRAQLDRVDFSVAGLNTFPISPCGVGIHDGRLYGGTQVVSRIVMGWNPATGLIDRTYNDTGPATYTNGVGYLTTTDDGASDIVVTCGLNAGQGIPGHSAPVNVVNMSTLTSYGPAQFGAEAITTGVAPGNARVGRSHRGAYVIMQANDVLGIYKIDVTVNPFVMTRIGGHVPGDFGGTHFTNWAAPCYDVTDGNILACVTVDNTNTFMVKFNGTTGAIIWQTAIFNQCQDLHECSIQHGRISWVEANAGTTYESSIVTATGALSRAASTINTGNNNAAAYFSDKFIIDIWNVSSSPGANPMWETFGPPPAPSVNQGGVIRKAS